MGIKVKAKLISSLEKVFLDEELCADNYTHASALRGERFSLQVAVYAHSDGEVVELSPTNESMRVSIMTQSDLAAPIELFEVGQVPVMHPVMSDHDEDYLRTCPGLYPDPLIPHKGKWSVASGQWRCAWITINIPKDAPNGIFPININICPTESPQEILTTLTFALNIIPAILPTQTLLLTQWLHLDCIATHYGTSIFSEEHWCLIEKYIKHAADHGVTLLFTPVFTPPIDTEVGGERPTVQLVDVSVKDGDYIFDFAKLDRYMQLAESCGVYNFEISHLFTQWGASAAPKIMVTEDGEYKQLFGWETDAQSNEYGHFLREFLKNIKEHLGAKKRLDNCWFHISDEPSKHTVDGYCLAKKSIWMELHDCKVIDALSECSIYEQGIIQKPIPSLDVVETFINKGLSNPWTYYCCGQGSKVSNRFISMPSYRNRILGWQFFKYGIEGFLQWGFNFWYSFLSRDQINPFMETGGQDAFPAGDAFVVYPGGDGNPISSVREAVFYETLQDMRALQLLESMCGKQSVLDIIDSDNNLTFTSYARDSSWILNKREEINERISTFLTNKESKVNKASLPNNAN